MILDTNALSASIARDASVGELLRRQTRAAIPVIVLDLAERFVASASGVQRSS